MVAVGVQDGFTLIEGFGVDAQLTNPPTAFLRRNGCVQDGDVRVVIGLRSGVNGAPMHFMDKRRGRYIRRGH